MLGVSICFAPLRCPLGPQEPLKSQKMRNFLPKIQNFGTFMDFLGSDCVQEVVKAHHEGGHEI